MPKIATTPYVTQEILDEINNGEGINFAAAAKIFPPTPSGKPPAASSLWRWADVGTTTPGGEVVRLETVRVGRTIATTRGAIKRFLAALNPVNAVTATTKPMVNRSARQKQIAAAESELATLGI